MLVTTHLFIPGPTNIPEAVRPAMDIRMEDMRSAEFPKFTPGSGSAAAVEHFRATTKASATSRPEPKLKLAS